MEINPVKGTHDIIADEANLYTMIEHTAMMVAGEFGYQEIRTPIIEHTPLFLRSVGESSDIVNKEMYTFEDKGGRSVTLRPELTAGIMRSIVSNKLHANADLPLKYRYVGPCFRYERPQAGRYRQFNQLGVEAIGAPSVYQDAEVITLGQRILLSVGLAGVKVLINSLGDEESRTAYKEALREFFSKHIDEMCEDCKRRLEVNPLRILDCKVPADIELVKNAPKMTDYLTPASKAYLQSVISILESVGISTEVDPTLVRGLDYYTGVVFEYHFEKTEGIDDVGALGAGGHYANLLNEIGGPSLEGVGLAFGVERLAYIIKSLMNFQGLPMGLDFYLMGMTDEIIKKNYVLADMLRDAGFSGEMNYATKSMGSLFKVANRKGAKFAIIVGEDEVAKNEVAVKNMKTQEQTMVKLEDLENVMHSLINKFYADFEQSETVED